MAGYILHDFNVTDLTRGHVVVGDAPTDADKEVSYVDWQKDTVTATFMDGSGKEYPKLGKVAIRTPAEQRQILLVYTGLDGPRMAVGTIKNLAAAMLHLDYDDDDAMQAVTVYALDADNVPVVVNPEVDRPAFDADEVSRRTVAVTFPDGAKVSAGYQIDGRV